MTENSNVATQPQETFQDQDLSLEVKRLPACVVEMLATVSPRLSNEAMTEAAQRVGERVNLPGFRKGKVPADLVRKNFSKEVSNEWRNALAATVGKRAFELSGLQPYDPSGSVNFALKDCTPENGGQVVLRYETVPADVAVDAAAFEVPTCEITDELRQKAEDRSLESVRLFLAEWEPVTDRAVQEDDFVDLDVETLGGDEAAQLLNDRRFNVNEQMPQWLRQALVGAKIGDVIETETQVDERAPESVKEQFKPSQVKITIRGINRPILPAIDEEFLKKVQLESEEKLKEAVKTQAEGLLQSLRTRERDEAIRRQLGSKLTFDIPMSLIEREMRFQMGVALMRMPEEQRKAMSREQMQAMFNNFAPSARDAVRMIFLGRELVKDGKASLDENELNQIFQQMLQDHVRQHGEPKREEVQGLVDHLRGITMSQGLMRVAMRYILANGTPVDRPHPFV